VIVHTSLDAVHIDESRQEAKRRIDQLAKGTLPILSHYMEAE
jgi:hypothetical protein